MKLILLPKDAWKFKREYENAINKAEELYLFTAYLTEWEFKRRLNSKCKIIRIYFGTDFGITRKNAVKKVFKWLPPKYKGFLFAVDKLSGFHPKLLAWKREKKYFITLGSSNLTGAGFEKNYEANYYSKINKKDYDSIINWSKEFESNSTRVNEYWINKYKQGSNRFGHKIERQTNLIINLKSLPKLSKAALEERQRIIRRFFEIQTKLTKLIFSCAKGDVSNIFFWKRMYYGIWGQHTSRIQGRGFEILGKHSNWKEICKSLLEIFKARTLEERDIIVQEEIDFLAKKQNGARKSWLSEILAHYYPKSYPIINYPSNKWLSVSKYRSPVGISEGAEYIDVAGKFRDYLKTSKQYNDLLELDRAVWEKYPKN